MKAKNPKPGPSVPARSIIAADPQRWRPHARSILLLWTFLLLAYSNSFRTGLIFDNRLAILQDTRVQAATAENVSAIIGGDYWHRTSSSGLYRPLTKLSYLVNYAVLGEGPNPAGYHWVNFALHAVNATLVYLLGLVLFRDRPKRMVMAIAFALVWSLHPVLTESVTNVIGRADLLAGLGILGGLLCHIQAKATSGWCKAAWLGSLALLAAIGSFSKESGVMVIVVILVHDLTFEGLRAWRCGMSSYAAATLPIAAFLLARQRVLGGLPELVGSFYDNPLLYADFFTARLTAIKVLGEYVWLLLWPVRLSCDYSYNQIPVALKVTF